MKDNYYLTLLVVVTVVGVGSVGLYVFAQSQEQTTTELGVLDNSLLYLQDKALQRVDSNSDASARLVESFSGLQKTVFLSPNRQFIAVTIEESDQSGRFTFITDTDGNVVKGPESGSFIDWAPDSQSALLYLSAEATGHERKIFKLATTGEYRDIGLPGGAISAAVSPNGDIVYSLTDSQTDISSVFLRLQNGKERLLIESDGILAWLRWSPDGKTIVVMESDLLGRPDKQHVLVIDTETSKSKVISGIQWNYPPVWADSANKFVFASTGNIYEYDVDADEAAQRTHFTGKFVQHPSYSRDGAVIVFSDGNQIFSVTDGDVTQITTGDGSKRYPILR